MKSERIGKEATWRQDESQTLALGCVGCPLFEPCGGLRVIGPALDCTAFCSCIDPQTCDLVCFRNTSHLVARMREVKGLSLKTITRCTPLPVDPMRGHAPMLYHGSSRARPLQASILALPLFAVLERRTGLVKYDSRVELAEAFGFSSDARIVLSGTAPDRPLERWWGLKNRAQTLQCLQRQLAPNLITSPNYSTFTDVPRPDNLYNIKRVFIAWSEILDSGVQSALSIVARTTRDYDHYIDFVAGRREVAYLSVEFATGVGMPSRIDWHARQLCRLANEVRRPLQLVVRGGLRILAQLSVDYENVLMIDTDPFVKTMKRQAGFLTNRLGLAWIPSAMSDDQLLDDLLQRNVEVRRSYHDLVIKGQADPLRSAGYRHEAAPSRRQTGEDKESLQMSFLDYDGSFEAKVTPVENQPVIASSKS